MNAKKFKRVIYLIIATAIVTIGIQVYRNVQNYQINKERFVRDVQQALDQSVEVYYADLTKSHMLLVDDLPNFRSSRPTLNYGYRTYFSSSTDTFSLRADSMIRRPMEFQSDSDGIIVMGSSKGTVPDSVLHIDPSSISSISVTSQVMDHSDSIELKQFIDKIIVSLRNQSIDFATLSVLFEEELARKKMDVDFAFWHYTGDSIFKSAEEQPQFLTASSKSTYLPRDEKLDLKFENASLIILQRGMFDIFLSLLISGFVIGSLLYLYRIINEQKALAEIKNDLISNITHEFKTPIATVSTAIEAISSFNQAKDPKVTSKYLEISDQQLKKLNGMVEKLLETATLDSEELDLSPEPVDVLQLSQSIFDKYEIIKGDKELSAHFDINEVSKDLDVFHFENAMGNLLDNALKYGGDKVEFRLYEKDAKLIWEVEDNGSGIEKQQQTRIFEKFYRVPTGNRHDVKGFGIGLYYTKQIVEKHQGEITLNSKPGSTKFKVIV